MTKLCNQKQLPTDKHRASSESWSIEDSERLYRIEAWGEPYFSISSAGHLTVSPQGDRGGSLDLYDLIEALRLRNLHPPILLRFTDILEDRLERLQSAFARAIIRYGYAGTYRCVFPIKCNQQRHLIDSLIEIGQRHHLGLEAGSKPELLIALASLRPPDGLLICNGYKDREYIETAILSQRLGIKAIIVLEQLQELPIVLEVAHKYSLPPLLGVRAKLNATGEGHWGSSTGERAKFGLTIPEIVQVLKELRSHNQLDALRLLHFHIGSQISSISVLKDALREACQIYTQLVQAGAPMGYLDVGGGLAVDYDGSKSSFFASKNYNTQNYANDVVAAVKEACLAKGVKVPTLLSESGRALASHQSVLVFDVLGASTVSTPESPPPPEPGQPQVIANMYEALESLSPEQVQEVYHDANQFKQEAISLFNFGYLTLEERALVEKLYWYICRKVKELLPTLDYVPDDLKNLEHDLASIYYINLSIFQSAPDTWALGQLFPILPIHRLNEKPTIKATLADLTCDSDGKFNRFIDCGNIKPLLEVHPLRYSQASSPDGHQGVIPKHEPYYLALFLGGAYQETMGSLHNLFGDTNTVHIRLTPQGYTIEHVVRGDTMEEVLSYVQYDCRDLLEKIRLRTEQALEQGKISIEESQILLENYEASLRRYTYLTAP